MIHIRHFRFALEVAFYAEDRFNAGLLCGLGFRRKRLHNAVVGDRERSMTEAFCRFKRLVNVRNAVLCGHTRMQMQFNAFEFALILAPFKRNQAYVVCVKHQFACDLGSFCHALYEQVVSLAFRLLKLANDLGELFRRIEQERTIDGIRSVGYGYIQRVAGLILFSLVLERIPFCNGNDRAFDDDFILAFRNVANAPFQRGSDVCANQHAFAYNLLGLDRSRRAVRCGRGRFSGSSCYRRCGSFRLVGLLREPHDLYARAAGLFFQCGGEFLRNGNGKFPLATKKDRQQVLLTVQRPMIQRYGSIVNADAPQR